MALPETKYIGATKYRLMVFIIREFSAAGVPQLLQMIGPSQIVKLSETEPHLNQFMTAYVPEHMTQPDVSKLPPTEPPD